MVFAWLKEYEILNRFATNNKIPARNLLLTSGVFAFSFIVRTLLDFTALFDAKGLINLQEDSC
jgi:hypothetical protein